MPLLSPRVIAAETVAKLAEHARAVSLTLAAKFLSPSRGACATASNTFGPQEATLDSVRGVRGMERLVVGSRALARTLRRLPIRYRQPYAARHYSVSWNLMIGGNPLFVSKQHGHNVITMLTTYAAWLEEAQPTDVRAIRAGDACARRGHSSIAQDAAIARPDGFGSECGSSHRVSLAKWLEDQTKRMAERTGLEPDGSGRESATC